MACFSAEIDRTSRTSSPRSTDLPPTATVNAEIDLRRRLAADLGMCHMHPHLPQVLAYSRRGQGNRT
jgi:hypothetical protein